MRKVEVKKVPENIKMVPSGGEVKVNRPLVEAMKVRLEHEMWPQGEVNVPYTEGEIQQQTLAKLLALTIEVRGGGVAGPFEATLTEVGARTILDCLK